MISRRFDELTARELHDLARLRSEVFVVEQGCAYLDLDGRDTEPATVHHWIEADGAIACYARTLSEPDGAIRIGRVVTAPRARGQGMAGALMGAVVDRHPSTRLVLDAQSHLAEWYARFGFEVVGDEYLDDGIPHLPMHREPASR